MLCCVNWRLALASYLIIPTVTSTPFSLSRVKAGLTTKPAPRMSVLLNKKLLVLAYTNDLRAYLGEMLMDPNIFCILTL